MKKNGMRISYQDWLFLCFLAGVLAGTVTANLLSGELQNQIGCFDTTFLTEQVLSPGEKQDLWKYVLRERGLEFTVTWLISLTVFAVPGFYGLAALAGGSVGVILSVITMQKGAVGLLCYLATIFPQVLCYIPICLILASWAGEEKHTIRLPGLLALALLVLAGTVLEVYFNPGLLKIITKM